MKKLLLIIILLNCCVAFSQKTVDVEIKLVNDNDEPLQNVSVRTDDGYLMGVSDWRGELKLRSVKTGDVMNFSHVAYHEMEYKITEEDIKDKYFTIKMYMKFYELPEVTVVENVPHVAYDNKVVSIADYEMNEQGIYLLAHRMRNYSLLHLSYDFDTLAEIELPRKFDRFYKDVYDQIHVLSQDSAYWVGTMKLNTFPLTFHKHNSWNNKVRLVEGWNKKVLMDEHNSAFYAVFLNQGVTTLKKIDVAHGTVSNSAVFGGFPFIENLKIYNGKAYFLYANDYTNNKRLYEVAIE